MSTKTIRRGPSHPQRWATPHSQVCSKVKSLVSESILFQMYIEHIYWTWSWDVTWCNQHFVSILEYTQTAFFFTTSGKYPTTRVPYKNTLMSGVKHCHKHTRSDVSLRSDHHSSLCTHFFQRVLLLKRSTAQFCLYCDTWRGRKGFFYTRSRIVS